MRANRLISLLLLLQSRETLTAGELAAELNVARRTIYRDIDALCEAGIPIYADYGAHGGYRLLEDYRNELAGLTQAERGALLLLQVPSGLELLNVGRALKTALLKLTASATEKPQVVLLDWLRPVQEARLEVHLQRLYDASQAGRKVHIRYRKWGWLEIERAIEPLGLVYSGGAWHLVAGGGTIQAQPVSDLETVVMLSETFVPPADFDLEACWARLNEQTEPAFRVMLRISPELRHWWTRVNGPAFHGVREDESGWSDVEVAFDDFTAALRFVLACGGAAEVVAPEPLRLTVQDYAAQILRRYGHAAPQIALGG